MEYSIRLLLKSLSSADKSNEYDFILWTIINKFSSPDRLSKAIIDELESRYSNNLGLDIESKDIILSEEVQEGPSISRFKSKIKSLEINSFRGFGVPEKSHKNTHLDFNNFNIFYGPNGSGKSTFCESLEFILTGNIKEAYRRGIELKEYIQSTKTTSEPKINITFQDSSLDFSKLNPFEKNEFEKCFIDRNRIQEFALLSGSKDTNVKHNDIIARILGFSDLDEFRNRFVQQSTFRSNASDCKKNHISGEITLLNQKNSRYKVLFDEAYEKKRKIDLQNTRDSIEFARWKISQLERIASRNTAHGIVDYTIDNINIWIKKCIYKTVRYQNIQDQISENVEDVNFKSLYEAIKILQNTTSNICPACKTPIENVSKNPFDFADIELDRLSHLDTLQLIQEELIQSITADLWNEADSFFQNYDTAISIYSELKSDEIDRLSQLFSRAKTNEDKVTFLNEVYDSSKNKISTHIDFIEKFNKITAKEKRVIKLLSSIENRIDSFRKDIDEASTRERKFQESNSDLLTLYPNISSYQSKLHQLNNALYDEKKLNTFLDNLIIAYSSFYSDMNQYIIDQQKIVIQKIEDRVLYYYNKVNEGDSKHEATKYIRFIQVNSRYEIELHDHSNKKIKAAKKLSEGHIRALGLAILLANSESSDLPIIVFDDVINAIDSDHRANIIKLINTDPFLLQIQIIITTHDRFFWERFCNEFSIKKKLSSITIKYTDQGIILYSYNPSYESSIDNALNNYDIRQALLYARIWFETIARQFCYINNVDLTGKYSGWDINSINVPINSIYKKLNSILHYDTKSLDILHNDTINSKGLNQEHHSFNEYNYNFSHSYTSDEVIRIIKAVKDLQVELDFHKNPDGTIDREIKKYYQIQNKIKSFTNRTPVEVQIDHFQASIRTFNSIKGFIDKCEYLKLADAQKSKIEIQSKKVFISELMKRLNFPQIKMLYAIRKLPPEKCKPTD